MGPLTSFAERPSPIRFETQHEKEIVELFLRQHVIVNLGWVLTAIVMIVAPWVIFPVFFSLITLPFTIPANYIVVAVLAWYLGTFGFVLANFIDWFFNIYIVTNERLVDIDFLHLLYKHFTQAEIYRIQEISFTTGGIIATFFNYGTVFIQTAGDMPNIEFANVPFPERVVQIIRKQMEKRGGVRV